VPAEKAVHQPVAAFNTKAMAEKSVLKETVSQVGMQMSGDIVAGIEKKLTPGWTTEVVRTALHAGVAGVSAAVSGDEIGSAMTGAAAGHVATQVLSHTSDLSSLGKTVSSLAQNTVAGLAGAGAGYLVSSCSTQGAYSGGYQAGIGDRWNRQLHENECVALDELLEGKSPEERQRLREAAAYLTRASKGVPQQDTRRAELEGMEARGKTHTAELRELNKTNLFQYMQKDGFWDWLSRHDEGIERGLGTLQTSFGVAGFFGSYALGAAATLTTGNPAGIVVGAGLGTLSAQAVATGVQRAFGAYESKKGQQVLDALDLATYPGTSSWPLEIGLELGVAAMPWGMGKFAHLSRKAFGKLPAHQVEAAFREGSFFGASAKSLRKQPVQHVELDTATLIASAKRIAGQDLTEGGRGIAKHPEYFGFLSEPKLRAVYRTPKQLNELAEQQIQEILKYGKKTSGVNGKFPEGWVTYTLPNKVEGSWTASGKFIGFRGPPLEKGMTCTLWDSKTASETIIETSIKPNL
jgi:hypothetical protein